MAISRAESPPAETSTEGIARESTEEGVWWIDNVEKTSVRNLDTILFVEMMPLFCLVGEAGPPSGLDLEASEGSMGVWGGDPLTSEVENSAAVNTGASSWQKDPAAEVEGDEAITVARQVGQVLLNPVSHCRMHRS